MKISIIIILLFLMIFSSYSQINNFKLEYQFVGMGSNRGKNFYPVVSIHKNEITYSTGILKARKHFKQSSIDSIISLLSVLQDSAIFRSNECIHSGGIFYLDIWWDNKKVSFSMLNTFDPIALKIVRIINIYLSKSNKIGVSEKLIEAEKECMEYYQKELKKRSENKKP